MREEFKVKELHITFDVGFVKKTLSISIIVLLELTKIQLQKKLLNVIVFGLCDQIFNVPNQYC